MSITIVLGTIVMLLLFPSCGGKKKITGDAITERDSMAVMQTSGVTTLISDSGVSIKFSTSTYEVDSNKNNGCFLSKVVTISFVTEISRDRF